MREVEKRTFDAAASLVSDQKISWYVLLELHTGRTGVLSGKE